jgi:type II secretory pathway pseudopilin PulG
MRRKHSRFVRRGFTLIETAIATLLIGAGVVALLLATGTCTKVNRTGKELSQAMFLTQEIYEYYHVRDFDSLGSQTFSPPINGAGETLSELSGWSQTTFVVHTDPDHLAAGVITDPNDPNYIVSSDAKYVSCQVSYNGEAIYEAEWIIMR